MSTKIVFCWPDISGYMAACWHALQNYADIDLHVLAFQARTETAFSDELVKGVSSRLLDLEERADAALIRQHVILQKPDVVVICGWFHKPYRQLVSVSALRNVRFIMGMDTPWQGTWRQRLAPVLLRSYLDQMESVVVTGERSWQYAKHLGIDTCRLHRGMYGIDYENWSTLLAERQQSAWPRSFLFAGRYIPIKAIDVLVAAYQRYRTQVADPWSLVCCGKGELSTRLDNQLGIENKGFVQPDEMRGLWRQAGAFVLPSRFDPWPLAIVEAAAAGLPIVCTNACGSAVEVVRDWHNGLIVPEDSVDKLAAALVTLHRQYDVLPEWGMRSQQLAAPYSAAVWVRRWQQLLLSKTTLEAEKHSFRPHSI